MYPGIKSNSENSETKSNRTDEMKSKNNTEKHIEKSTV